MAAFEENNQYCEPDKRTVPVRLLIATSAILIIPGDCTKNKNYNSGTSTTTFFIC
jgi:hypothetical protein